MQQNDGVAAVDEVSRRVARMVEDGSVPALSYVAVSADKVLLELHAGKLDASGMQTVGPQTLYMACSITKALTAIAVVGLASAGRLSLSDPLSQYLPEHPYGERLRLDQLLAHSGGVPNPLPLDWFAVEGEPLDRAARLAAVLRDKPRLEESPGTKYRYSNVGYWLLEKVVSRVTDLPFADAVQKLVFDPLGIADQDARFSLPPANRLATGHIRKWRARTAVFYLLTPKRYWQNAAGSWSRFARLRHHGLAYGGLYVTARALAKVLQDLLRDSSVLLKPPAKRQMWAPFALSDGSSADSTLGWAVGQLGGHDYVGKQGGGLGFHGNIRIYRESGVATVFLANSTEVSPGPVDARSDTLDAPWLD